MKKTLLIAFIFLSIATTVHAQTILKANGGGTGYSTYTIGDLIYASATNLLAKLGIGTNGQCLTISGGLPAWAACGGGGGNGNATWSTTTSQVTGQYINYPNNSTDVVNIGSVATTTGKMWFDPNVLISYIKGKLGISTTSPYAPLSVVGQGGVVAENYTATSTATSTFAGPITMQGYGIATSTTVCKYPENCTYQTFGTNDDVQFNAAITKIAGSGGGIVYVKSGTYNTSATITNTTQGVWIKGEGGRSTTINYTGSGNAIQLGNRQSSGVMVNNMGLSDIQVNVTGTGTSLKIDGGGQGGFVHNFTGNGGNYGLVPEDLDRFEFKNVYVGNFALAGMRPLTGKENTYGKVSFDNVHTVANTTGSVGWLWDTDWANQTSPNSFEDIIITNSLVYSNTGITTKGMQFNVGVKSFVVQSTMFENNDVQVDAVGTTTAQSVNADFQSDSFINSGTNSTDIFQLNNYTHNITSISNTFQQAVNAFHDVSGFSNVVLEGKNNNQGNLTFIWTGTFASRTGNDTNFAGNGILASGLSASRFTTVNSVNGDFSGLVGIGTTSPTQKLVVAGTVQANNFNSTSTTATSTFEGPIAVNGRTSSKNLVNISAKTDFGSASANTGEALVNIDNTLNTKSPALYIDSTQAGVPSNPMVIIRSESTSYNQGLLWLLGNANNTGGAAYGLKIDDGNPDIEFREHDQTTPTGEYEIDVNNDLIRINGRNAANNSFDTIGWFARKDRTNTVAAGTESGTGGKFCMGCTFSYVVDTPLIGAIGTSSPWAPYFGLSTDTSNLGNIFTVTKNGNTGIGTSSPTQKLVVAGRVDANNFNATSTATSTFAGPITMQGWYLATSTTVCRYPDFCQYQATTSSAQFVINQAINDVTARGGGNVYVKNGIYNLDNSINLKNGVTLKCDGYGTKIVASAGYTGDSPPRSFAIQISNVRNSGVENCHIDGGNQTNYDYDAEIKLTNSTTTRIVGNWMENVSAFGIFAKADVNDPGNMIVDDLLFQGNTVTSNGIGGNDLFGGGHAESFTTFKHLRMIGNFFTAISNGDPSGGENISTGSGQYPYAVNISGCRGCTYVGNTFNGWVKLGYDHDLNEMDTIADNVIRPPQGAITALLVGLTDLAATTSPYGIDLHNNKIYSGIISIRGQAAAPFLHVNLSGNTVIPAYDTSTITQDAFNLSYINHGIATNNTLTTSTTTLATASTHIGFKLKNVSNFDISDNSINGFGWGIYDLSNDNTNHFGINLFTNITQGNIPATSTATILGKSGSNFGIGTTTPWGGFSINPNALGVGVPEFVIGSSTATRFEINGTGDIGINAIPSGLGKLYIKQSVDSNVGGITMQDSGIVGSLRLWLDSNGVNHFDGNSGGTQSIIVNKGGGKVAFGATTTPYAQLSVTATAAATPTVAIYGFTNQTADLFSVSTTTGTATSSVMTIKSTGKIGLGTTTPSAVIDSYTNASTTNALLEAASGLGGCLIIQDVGASPVTYTMIYTKAGTMYSKAAVNPNICQ